MRSLLKIFLKILCAAVAAAACVQAYAAVRPLWKTSDAPFSRNASSYSKTFAADRERLSSIYLKNGNALTGEIVDYAPSHLTVEWNGALIAFSKTEIAKVGIAVEFPEGIYLKAARSASWPYASNPVVRTSSGATVDGEIVAAGPDRIVVREKLSEGHIDYELPAASVRALVWRPFAEKENAEARRVLASKHPAISKYVHTVSAEPSPTAGREFARGVQAPASASIRAIQKAAKSYSEFWRLFKSIAA